MKYQIKANIQYLRLSQDLERQEQPGHLGWATGKTQFSMSASGLKQLSQKTNGEGMDTRRLVCNCMPKVNNCIGFGKGKYAWNKQRPDNGTVKYASLMYKFALTNILGKVYYRY